MMSVCSACTKIEKSTISVLDIGGGVGLHYRQAAKFVSGKAFDWPIFDTPACAAVAAPMGASSGLSFTSDLDAALSDRYDIVLASGALQYVGHWADLLDRFDADYVAIDRALLAPEQLYFRQEVTRDDGCVQYVYGETIDLRHVGEVVSRRWIVEANWQTDHIAIAEAGDMPSHVVVGGMYLTRKV